MFNVQNITSKKMKKYRLWLNLTQEQIAEKFGVNSNTYACWERGEQTPESLNLIALAFEALLNQKLVAEKETKPPYKKLFKNLDEEIEFYIKDIDRMQKIRVSS